MGKQKGQGGHSRGGAPNEGKQGNMFVGVGGKDAGFGIDHVADEVEGEVATQRRPDASEVAKQTG